MKKIYSLFILLGSFFSTHAQWNSNNAANLQVAAGNADDIITKATSDGKTFIAFYSLEGRNYNMRAQLLDAVGHRMFGDSGILISSRHSGTATFVFNTCVDNSNNLIIAFQSENAGNYQILAYKIDTLGNELWGKNGKGIILGNGFAPYPVALSTNEVVVAWPNDTGLISYQKISAAGTPAWDTAKLLTGSHTVTRPQVLSRLNGAFDIVYQSEDIPPFYTHLYEQGFDNNGNTLWTSPTQLSNIVTAGYNYYSVLNDNDTTYVGYFGNPPGQNRFNGFVQRVNPDGSLPWNINGASFADYTAINQPFVFYVNIAHEQGAPNIWAVATLSGANQVKYGISVQNFVTANGTRLLGNFGKSVFSIDSLATQQQGSLSLCFGHPLFMYTNITNRLFATELDKNGNFAWAKTKATLCNTLNSKGRFGFTKTVNGQAIAVWQEDKGSGSLAYAQNILCSGKTGPEAMPENDDAIINKIIPAQASLKIYPNPVSSILTLNIISPLNDEVHVLITDVTGKILASKVSAIAEGNNALQINTASLSPGIYFLKAISANGKNIMSAQKFVKQ